MLVSENITTDEHGDWDGRDGILLFDDRRPRRPLWPPDSDAPSGDGMKVALLASLRGRCSSSQIELRKTASAVRDKRTLLRGAIRRLSSTLETAIGSALVRLSHAGALASQSIDFMIDADQSYLWQFGSTDCSKSEPNKRH